MLFFEDFLCAKHYQTRSMKQVPGTCFTWLGYRYDIARI